MTTDLTQFAASGGKTLYTQTFTSSGTWTKPSGVDLCWISASGGGGGGGGSRSAMSGYQGAYVRNGSGGNAGYWILDMPIVPSGNLTVTIGAAGSAGSTSSGGSGGATSITDGGVVVVNCDGGTGGVQVTANLTPTQPPDYGNLWAGGRGGLGYYYHYSGSYGGDNPTRIHRTAGSYGRGGGGGSNPFGSGGNGSSNGNGAAAGGNGGGGGGGGRTSATYGYSTNYYSGGAGKKGIVIVKWLA